MAGGGEGSEQGVTWLMKTMMQCLGKEVRILPFICSGVSVSVSAHGLKALSEHSWALGYLALA